MEYIGTCRYCGGLVKSISIGWKCEDCGAVLDMKGEWHEAAKKEPFITPEIGTTCEGCLHFWTYSEDYPCNQCKRNPYLRDMWEKGS